VLLDNLFLHGHGHTPIWTRHIGIYKFLKIYGTYVSDMIRHHERSARAT